MKRTVKLTRDYIGKSLLRLLVKLKMFNSLSYFVKIFPKEIYRASFGLMKRGYLDLAFKIVKNHTPKENEKQMINRIFSMIEIKKTGLIFETIEKESIEKVNVLFAVHNSLPYDNAGYALRTHSVVTKLKEHGINVLVATRAGYPWDIQKHRQMDDSIKENIVDGVRYLRLADDNKTFKKDADFKYVKTYSDQLIKTIKKNNITILHAHSNYLNALSAIKAANEMGIPSIYEIRGLWHLTRLTIDKSYKYNGMFEYEEEMVKGAAKSADAVITISEALKKLIVSWGIDSKKITVIPNAVDINLFNPEIKSLELLERFQLKNKFVIGFIGSITAYEGLDYLIRTVNSLSKEKKDIVLMIVGDGRELESLKKLVKTKNITFVGRISHSEAKKYYSIFDICVYPRTKHEVTQYVPPLKPLEAMAMKKPVIVSDLEPLMEIVKDKKTGLVCKANDIDSLKEKILELYSSKELCQYLLDTAYIYILKERTWDQNIKLYKEVYESFKSN